MHRTLTFTLVVAMVLAAPAGIGAAVPLDSADTQSTLETNEEHPTQEELDTYAANDDDPDGEPASFHEEDGEGDGEEDGESAEDGDSDNYNENNVAVVNLEDELVVDVARGHVGDGSEHQTADDDDGSDAENSNQNNVAVVQTQDNAIVKGGGSDEDDGGEESPSPDDLGEQ